MPQAASMLFWVMSFGCLAAPSSASCLDLNSDVTSMYFKMDKGKVGSNKHGIKVGNNDDCIDILPGSNSLASMSFMKMPFTMTVNVNYASSDPLSVSGSAFQMTPIIVKLECDSGCGNGDCKGSTSLTEANCGCPVRTNSLGAGGHGSRPSTAGPHDAAR